MIFIIFLIFVAIFIILLTVDLFLPFNIIRWLLMRVNFTTFKVNENINNEFYDGKSLEFLEEIHTKYKNLEKDDQTLESLIINLSTEYSELYLRLLLNSFKAQNSKFSNENSIGFVALFIALSGLFVSIHAIYWSVLPMIFAIVYIFVRPLSPKVKKLSEAIFLIEEALKLKTIK